MLPLPAGPAGSDPDPDPFGDPGGGPVTGDTGAQPGTAGQEPPRVRVVVPAEPPVLTAAAAGALLRLLLNLRQADQGKPEPGRDPG